jgi:hypothetical protein
VCGVQNYQWRFTQVYPAIGLPIDLNGTMNSRIMALANIPSIANGQRYDVKIRALHLDLITYSVWPSGNDCVKTIGAAGLPFEIDNSETLNSTVTGEVSIFPNPSINGKVQIKMPAEGLVMAELLDQYGKVVFVTQWLHTENSMHEIAVKLSPGMYHWRLKQNGQFYSLRWVRQ